LEIVLFNTLLRRSLEAVGFAYVVWSSSSAEISSSIRCKNEVKMSSSAEVSGSSTRYEVRASSSAEVLESSVWYVSVVLE
jgi:hypothetical protein